MGLFVVVVDLVNAFGFVPLCFETSDENQRQHQHAFWHSCMFTPVNLPQQCRLLRAQHGYQFVRIRNAAEKVNAFNRRQSQQSRLELGLGLSH